MRADRFEVACFVLIAFAAVIRVFGGMLLSGTYPATVVGLRHLLVRRVCAIRDSLLAGVVAQHTRRQTRVGRAGRMSPFVVPTL
jgi:hypothetical protein